MGGGYEQRLRKFSGDRQTEKTLINKVHVVKARKINKNIDKTFIKNKSE